MLMAEIRGRRAVLTRALRLWVLMSLTVLVACSGPESGEDAGTTPTLIGTCIVLGLAQLIGSVVVYFAYR